MHAAVALVVIVFRAVAAGLEEEAVVGVGVGEEDAPFLVAPNTSEMGAPKANVCIIGRVQGILVGYTL